jgi:hypothetical protein
MAQYILLKSGTFVAIRRGVGEPPNGGSVHRQRELEVVREGRGRDG